MRNTNRNLSRRDLLRHGGQLSAGLAAAGFLAACGSSGDDSSSGDTGGGGTSETGGGGESSETGDGGGSGGSGGEVRIAVWGGEIKDANIKYVFEPFTKETGIKVIAAGPPSDAKLKAMIDSGNLQWDCSISGISSVVNLGTDYFEKLPDSVMNVDGVPDRYKYPYAAPYYLFGTVIGWDKNQLGDKKMESWADFWDTKTFPGPRSLSDGMGATAPLEFALLADGVDIEKLYPLDIDRGFKVLEKIRGDISQWWSSGSQPGQMLTSGAVSAASIWSGRVNSLIEKGADLGYTYNQQCLQLASASVLHGAPNKKNAFTLLEYMQQADVQARVWGNWREGPANEKAFKSLPEDYANSLPTLPTNAEKGFLLDQEWWGEHREEVLKRFNQFRIG